MSRDRAFRRWGLVVAILSVLVVYFRIVGAPFVWDDRHIILEAPSVTAKQPLSSYFGHAFWTSPETGDERGYYRPLTTLSFALEYSLHGPNPAPFHLTNLALHTINLVLLYLLLRRWCVPPSTTVVLAGAWALAPRLTEAVAWVVGRTDVLATTCVLAALLVHRPNRAWRVVSASLLVFCGLLAKEVAVAGVVALVALGAHKPRARALNVLTPLAALAVYAALRHHALGGYTGPPLARLDTGTRLSLSLSAVAENARMLVFPWRPELQIGNAAYPSVPLAIIGGVIVLALMWMGRRFVVGTWRSAGANARALFVTGISLAVVGIGLVLHIVPIVVKVVAADRFLYLPTAGVALLVAPLVHSLARHSTRVLPFAIAVLVSFAIASYWRVDDWCSELRLWATAYRHSPQHNGIAANELGNVYYRAGLYEQAADAYVQALRLEPTERSAPANHALALSELGQYDRAYDALVDLCARMTDVADNCLFAGVVELHRFHFDSARVFIHLARERAPTYRATTSALNAVSKVEAIVARPDYNSVDPIRYATLHFDAAQVAGRRLDALRYAEQLLTTPNAPMSARRNAAEFYVAYGRPSEIMHVLEAPSAHEVLDETLLTGAALRVTTAKELLDAWPSLGIPSSER